MALKSLAGLRKQVVVIEPMVREMMIKFQQLQEVPSFIERSLPLMIHYQVSEAIKATVCPPRPPKGAKTGAQEPLSIEARVANFQLQQLREILDYNNKTIGQQ